MKLVFPFWYLRGKFDQYITFKKKEESILLSIPKENWIFVNKFGFLNRMQFFKTRYGQFYGQCGLKLISLIPLSREIFRRLINYLRIIGYEITVARIYSRTMDDKYLRYCYFIVISPERDTGRPSISRAQTTLFRIAFRSFLYRGKFERVDVKWS